MKLIGGVILCLMFSHSSAVSVRTLPDVRYDTPTEKDIASHEKARADAAKVTKNPQQPLIDSITGDMQAIGADLSFGVSFSQKSRNDHAKKLASKIGNAVVEYTNKLLAAIDKSPDEAMTEQIAHNIGVFVFHDVQLEDYMKQLEMPENNDLILSINRLKSLQKLYLFEQKGGENYLSEEEMGIKK